MKGLSKNRYEQAQLLFDSGITILPASDTGGYQEPGSIRGELDAWANLGVPVDEILSRATLKARQYLRSTAGFLGGIADLMIYEQCPSRSVDALLHPTQICRGGMLVASV